MEFIKCKLNSVKGQFPPVIMRICPMTPSLAQIARL